MTRNSERNSQSGPRAALGAGNPLVPHNEDYPFDEVFNHEYGESGFETSESDPVFFNDSPVMEQVLMLEEAKQAAAAAAGKLLSAKARISSKNPSSDKEEEEEDDGETSQEVLDAIEDVRGAERGVIERRIEILNKLLAPKETDLRLVYPLEKQGANKIVTCVQYKLMHKDRSRYNFLVQSPVSFVAPDLSWILTKCLYNPAEGLRSGVIERYLNTMLENIVNAAPHNGTTEELRDLYATSMKGKMKFRAVDNVGNPLTAHWQQSEPYNWKKYMFISDNNGGAWRGGNTVAPVPRVEVMVGGLNINYCEHWHNPLINKYVQKAVLASSWYCIENHFMNNNAIKLTVCITHKFKKHILELTPFHSPDTCTVQQLVTPLGMGILDLVDKKVSDVQSAEVPFIIPSEMQWCHCIGASRNKRFNEQELNFLHAEGFKLESPDWNLGPVDYANLPHYSELCLDTGTPLAKSTRISFTDWDVLVTTYRLTSISEPEDQQRCRTVITLVNYPPFGASFPKEPKVVYVNVQNPLNFGNNRQQKEKKRHPFKDMPQPGVMQYFIWYSDDARETYAINLIDYTADRRMTRDLMQHGLATNKKIYENFKDENFPAGEPRWIRADKNEMVANIKNNTAQGADPAQGTVRDMYLAEWREFVREIIHSNLDDNDNLVDGGPYLYCKKPEVWDLFVEGEGETRDLSLQHMGEYRDYSERRYKEDLDQSVIHSDGIQEQVPQHVEKATVSRFVGSSAYRPKMATIPLPVTWPQPNNTPTNLVASLVQQMKDRVQTLESRLEQATNDDNKDHLLRQVLEKLTQRHQQLPCPRP